MTNYNTAQIDNLVNLLDGYATSGGQEADKGIIKTAEGEFKVTDVVKHAGNKICHIGYVVSGMIKEGDTVEIKKDINGLCSFKVLYTKFILNDIVTVHLFSTENRTKFHLLLVSPFDTARCSQTLLFGICCNLSESLAIVIALRIDVIR